MTELLTSEVFSKKLDSLILKLAPCDTNIAAPDWDALLREKSHFLIVNFALNIAWMTPPNCDQLLVKVKDYNKISVS